MEFKGYPKEPNTEPYEIPIGINDGRKRITWKALDNPSLISVDSALSRNHLYKNIVGYCYERPEEWNVCYIGNKVGGFRLDDKIYTVPNIPDWSREDIINQLYRHIESVLEAYVEEPVSTESEPKPILFAVQNIENLLRNLKQPEMEKLHDILAQGLPVYLGLNGTNRYKQRGLHPIVRNTIDIACANGKALVVTGEHGENGRNTILDHTGNETPFEEYWSKYHFGSDFPVPYSLSSGYALKARV